MGLQIDLVTSKSGVTFVKKCDCNERIGTKINSWRQFEELKSFFETQTEHGLFQEIPVKKPYYVGYGVGRNARMEWYADHWYLCSDCGTLWEFVYPDFPAQGSVRKLRVVSRVMRKLSYLIKLSEGRNVESE